VNTQSSLSINSAYIWFAAIAVIVIVPFIFYGLQQAVSMIMVWSLNQYPESFADTEYVAADTFFNAVWVYMPVLIIIGCLVWAIARALKARRSGYES